MPAPPWLLINRDWLSLEKGGKPWLAAAGWVKINTVWDLEV
jgi:hypothetical protein